MGTYITAGQVLKSISKYHAKKLEKAMFAKAGEVEAALEAAGIPFVKLVKRATDETHHIVATGADKAKKAREILAKFDIDVDNPANGVFLPANLSSPNPLGSIVHATLANKRLYYETVEKALDKAKSQQDVIRILKRIRQTLEDGTFYHANL